MNPMKAALEGGLVGLLVGDALGVAYEFKAPEQLPPRSQLEFEPPAGFRRSHARAPAGAYSDDGAQALCLLESLLGRGGLDAADFGGRMLAWLDQGHLAVDRLVFDVGGQTSRALAQVRRGVPAERAGGTEESSNGNGSLMRVLPLALWGRHLTDAELVDAACAQSRVTHAHARSQACCAAYCLLARHLLREPHADVPTAALRACERVVVLAEDHEVAREAAELAAALGAFPPRGSGYVVDSFVSAAACNSEGTFEDVVKAAISLGHDTDTTAAIAGGLAGIRFGLEGIPERWRDATRCHETTLAPLLVRLTFGAS